MEQRGIEKRARELCYAEQATSRISCENYCSGTCRAVCPDERLLVLASRQLFREHWQAQGHEPRTLRKPYGLRAAWRAVQLWWHDLRLPDAEGYPGYKVREDYDA